MKKTAWVLAASIALVLGGCDGDGGSDGGGIVLMDSGPGGGTDAGPGGGTDAGPGSTGMCSVSGFMPLPMACFPRCAMATLVAANNCASAPDPAMCQQMALQADTTPSTTLTVGANSIDLDCESCVGWQQETCIAESCPTEFNAFLMCSQMMGAMCDAETMALNTCIMTNNMTINTCASPRATQCFSQTAGGFFPQEPRTIELAPLTQWTPMFTDPSFYPNL